MRFGQNLWDFYKNNTKALQMYFKGLIWPCKSCNRHKKMWFYVYFVKKCLLRSSQNSVRFEKSSGNRLPERQNSVRFYLIMWGMACMNESDIFHNVWLLPQYTFISIKHTQTQLLLHTWGCLTLRSEHFISFKYCMKTAIALKRLGK